MGYIVNMTRSSFKIPAKNIDKAFAAGMKHMKKMGLYETFKKCKNLQELLSAWACDTDLVDGDLLRVTYTRDTLIYNLPKYLNSIAEFVKPGSYIEMRGECGGLFMYYFKNNECHELDAKTVYNLPK